MFEGAVLLRGLLLGVLSHSTRAESGGELRWEGQCGTMLAAAEGRANSASSAAAVQFQMSGDTATLKRLGEDMCGG